MTERLQKLMARAGIASRRQAEQMILDGRVKVNGAVVDHLGAKVDPEADRVEVDGRALALPSAKTYLMLNKPVGYVTTASDELGRPTVLDLVSGPYPRLFPVGRLDMETEGLLLLTNDGELAFRLTHPKFKVAKTYVAEVDGQPTNEELNRLRAGVTLEDGRTAPAQVAVVAEKKGRTVLRISIWEGKKRQIRRMMMRIGHPTRKLKRISFGPLGIGNLPSGKSRMLSRSEVESLCRAAKLKVES